MIAGLLASGLVAGLLLGPPPASDEPVGDQVVGLSADGRRFASTLEVPLFVPALRWVPGDVRDSGFWVRNRAGGAAEVGVEVTAGEALPSWIRLQADTGAGWQDVGTPTTDTIGGALGPGETRHVRTRVTLRAGAPNGAMRTRTDLRFRVRLTDARATSSTATGPAGTSGLLPGTGSPAGPLGLVLAVALLVAGTAVVRHRRRP